MQTENRMQQILDRLETIGIERDVLDKEAMALRDEYLQLGIDAMRIDAPIVTIVYMRRDGSVNKSFAGYPIDAAMQELRYRLHYIDSQHTAVYFEGKHATFGEERMFLEAYQDDKN